MMVVSGRGSAVTEEVRMLRVVARRMSAFMLSRDICFGLERKSMI